MAYLGFSAALYMPIILLFAQYILRLLDTANMEFVNMFLRLVIKCDTSVDRQIHTKLTSFEPRQANLCLRAFRHDKF